MGRSIFSFCCRRGHTLMELMVASIASAFLLAGLGSVMMIGRQIAYTPSAAERRTHAAEAANQIAEELRCATLVIQQTPQIVEFVVADRDADGIYEKIRYEWSGTQGDPLTKKVNSAAAVVVLDSVHAFSASFALKEGAKTLNSTVESSEQVLVGNTAVQSGEDRDVSTTNHSAQQIVPAMFANIPSNAVSWNATKIDFYGRKGGVVNTTLLVQLRTTGDPMEGPTSIVLGQASVPEASLTAGSDWNTVVFANPIRNLLFHRRYAFVFAALGGNCAKLRTYDLTPTGVFESSNAGGSWQYMPTRMMFGRVYGTYNTPGPTYNVSQRLVSQVRLLVQASENSHSRFESSVPLTNCPAYVTAYWRADFDQNPVLTNTNGDAVVDWAVAGGGSFDSSNLIGGAWYASGALETQPGNDFTSTTFVEARCRNSTVGGNGAVLRINADRQGGMYAPLLVYVRRQTDGTQTLTLLGKPSDAATTTLFSRSRLSTDFVRYRLTILPQNNVVNLSINDEDQGTFTYPTYTPSSSSDRFVTFFADTSLAEFDYVDVRVAN